MVKESKAEGSTIRRSPGRTKSPSRKTKEKSPAKNIKESSPKNSEQKKVRQRSATRKSPSRGSPKRTKSPARAKKSTPVSSKIGAGDSKTIPKKEIIKSTKIDNEFSGSDDEFFIKEKPKATVRGRSRKLDVTEVLQVTGGSISNSYAGEVRRIVRNAQTQEERVVHLKHFDSTTKKLGQFSDDDEISVLSTKVPEKKQKTPLIKSIGVFIHLTFVPIFALSLFLFCNKARCSYSPSVNWNNLKSLSLHLNLRTMLINSAFIISLSVLSCLPFGGRKISSLPSKHEKFTYVANGLASLVTFIVICGVVSKYAQFSISNFIVDHLYHLLTSTTLLAILLSIFLYVSSYYAPVSAWNADVIDKSALIGFFYGREVNPRLLGVLDIKMVLLRMCWITLILLQMALMVKGLNWDNILKIVINLEWKQLATHSTPLVISFLHILYALDNLIFESKFISTHFVQYEGLGYRAILLLSVTPFFFALQTKTVLDHQIKIPLWQLLVVCLFFLTGLILSRLSKNQKDSFRRNPYSPTLAHLETISTSQGKKLLCSGWWGFVRKPSVLGEIMMLLSIARIGCQTPAVLGLELLLLFVIIRAASDETICRNKYGTSWDKYCHKVRHILIPKIY